MMILLVPLYAYQSFSNVFLSVILSFYSVFDMNNNERNNKMNNHRYEECKYLIQKIIRKISTKRERTCFAS